MELLFKNGKSISSYPVKIVYLPAAEPLPYPAQAMFVVPKRQFKRANRRNTLKRRMREVYRLYKSVFYESLKANEKQLVLALIYTGKKEEDYATIEKGLLKGLKKIC